MNNDKYITISAINKYLKYIIDENVHLNKVYLKGEISNFKAHTKGHFYFTLKDDNSRINAIMFSYQTKNVKFVPKDGMKVLVVGKISVYEEQGSYQIYVEEMIEDGIGNLFIQFEELKKKLSSEGLFDAGHKRAIPKFPKTIGIVTASTGAAIRDILTTIKRRYPLVNTILFPALVQGNGAKEDIVKKIELANNGDYEIDTLIVGRGGGSIEDLWAFNEEIVARAIYNSKIPVISAVGHEIDFTISDFVADLRAATPTAAAELAVPNISNIISDIEVMGNRLSKAILSSLSNHELLLKKIGSSNILLHPTRMYEIKEQKLDNYIDRININIKNLLEVNKTNLFKISNNYLLNNPSLIYKFKEQHYTKLVEKLEVLNPLSTLKRGYAIVRMNDHVVTDTKSLKVDDIIDVNISDGHIKSKIVEVKLDEEEI